MSYLKYKSGHWFQIVLYLQNRNYWNYMCKWDDEQRMDDFLFKCFSHVTFSSHFTALYFGVHWTKTSYQVSGALVCKAVTGHCWHYRLDITAYNDIVTSWYFYKVLTLPGGRTATAEGGKQSFQSFPPPPTADLDNGGRKPTVLLSATPAPSCEAGGDPLPSLWAVCKRTLLLDEGLWKASKGVPRAHLLLLHTQADWGSTSLVGQPSWVN